MNTRSKALATQLDPKAREYIEARLDELSKQYDAKLENINARIERVRLQNTERNAELNAKLNDIEDLVNLDIPSRRRLQELIAHLKELTNG